MSGDGSQPTMAIELDKLGTFEAKKENKGELRDEEMTVAAAMATQLLQNPSLFGLQNRNHNGAMMNGGMGSGRRGRKRKFSPEERMLLAQLYHDHFTIYHSKRYVGPDYIDTEASLKFLLLRDWAQKLSNLGVSERGTMDIGNRINEMIMEVADFRNVTNISYNTQMSVYQMSPSFLLFNKVYDYIYLVHESVERLLDAYEIKLCKDEEESILNAVNARKRKEWTTDEKKALSELYTSNAAIYNELPIRKKDHAAREALLKLWSTQISQIGVAKRTPEEIQAVIYTYRCMVGRSPADEPDTAWKTRGAKRRKRERSPTLEAVQAAGGVFPPVDDSMTVEKLFEEVKKVQDELMQDHPKREEERYEKALIMKKAVQLVSLEQALPQPAQPITAHTPSPAGRTNRPHMSRHEKHLLGMLYRKDHSDYETYNNPHVARKTPKNRKWQLLTTWAEKLTNLGVSKREPDELATKISQYKNIIKNHYQCMDGHTVNFSNEYKLRRCLRPLSPTTRLYDISQEIEELINDEEIEKYAKQAIDLRRFPMHFGMNLDAETNFSVYQPYKKDLMVKRLQIDEEDQSNEDKLLQIKEEPSEDVSPSTSVLVQSLEAKPLNLATIMKASRTIRDLEQNTYSKMYDTIYDDIKNMEKRSSDVVVYDCVDSSGHMTRMAITRYENDRDVNYFMWSRYLDIESMMPLTMYVCYMCEQMAQSASIANSTYGRRHPMMQMSMPNSNLLAQQSLPSIVVDDSSARQVGVSWVRAAPRHRCVPFLMSTLCEKMAEISHIIVRYHPSYNNTLTPVRAPKIPHWVL